MKKEKYPTPTCECGKVMKERLDWLNKDIYTLKPMPKDCEPWKYAFGCSCGRKHVVT